MWRNKLPCVTGWLYIYSLGWKRFRSNRTSDRCKYVSDVCPSTWDSSVWVNLKSSSEFTDEASQSFLRTSCCGFHHTRRFTLVSFLHHLDVFLSTRRRRRNQWRSSVMTSRSNSQEVFLIPVREAGSAILPQRLKPIPSALQKEEEEEETCPPSVSSAFICSPGSSPPAWSLRLQGCLLSRFDSVTRAVGGCRGLRRPRRWLPWRFLSELITSSARRIERGNVNRCKSLSCSVCESFRRLWADLRNKWSLFKLVFSEENKRPAELLRTNCFTAAASHPILICWKFCFQGQFTQIPTAQWAE